MARHQNQVQLTIYCQNKQIATASFQEFLEVISNRCNTLQLGAITKPKMPNKNVILMASLRFRASSFTSSQKGCYSCTLQRIEMTETPT